MLIMYFCGILVCFSHLPDILVHCKSFYIPFLGRLGGSVRSPTRSSSSCMMKPEDISSDATQAVRSLTLLFMACGLHVPSSVLCPGDAA